MKYAVVLPISINTPKASEIRMAKRIARSSLSSRDVVLRRDVIAVITVEPGSGAVCSSKVRPLPKLVGLPIFPQFDRWGCDGTHRRPQSCQ